MRWMRIESDKPPVMTAHADIVNGVVGKGPYDVAPIIWYMRGWPYKKVKAYCDKRGWRLSVHNAT